MTIGDIVSLIIALATTGSLIYISRQVNVAPFNAYFTMINNPDGNTILISA